MSPTELTAKLDAILERQRQGAFCVTGFYLTGNELREIAAELEPDLPQIGAVGRYRRTPIFPVSHFHGNETNHATIDVNTGIAYTYVRMDVVD